MFVVTRVIFRCFYSCIIFCVVSDHAVISNIISNLCNVTKHRRLINSFHDRVILSSKLIEPVRNKIDASPCLCISRKAKEYLNIFERSLILVPYISIPLNKIFIMLHNFSERICNYVTDIYIYIYVIKSPRY